jgi:hypothetical protein
VVGKRIVLGAPEDKIFSGKYEKIMVEQDSMGDQGEGDE